MAVTFGRPRIIDLGVSGGCLKTKKLWQFLLLLFTRSSFFNSGFGFEEMGLEPVIGCPDPGGAEEELTASKKKASH